MASLLDRIKGVEFGPNNDPENDPDYVSEIPDEVPADWSGLDADPVPGPRERPTAVVSHAPAPKVTPSMQKKIAEQIAMYIDLLAMPWAMRDSCGEVVQDQAEALGKAFAKILSRYPEAAQKMLATGVLGDWIAVGMAGKPIVEAIYHHHVVKTTDDGGADDFADFDDVRPGR